MRGCFVTGTDTGAGKTVLAGAIAAALRRRGVAVVACKPVLTGVGAGMGQADPLADGARQAEGVEGETDDVILARATGDRPERVAALRFHPPVSPHLAAQLAGRPIDPAALVEHVRNRAREGERVIVEGVGGLLVPLTDRGYTVRDLAVELDLPLVVAARPGLGTIGHTLLTLEAARVAGLDVRGVVLTPWPDSPGEVERSNERTIAELGAVEVHRLPRVPALTRAGLARAGGHLPVDRWTEPAAEGTGGPNRGSVSDRWAV